MAIGELHWRDEVGTDTALDFVTGPHGISVPTLTSRGPRGALAGEARCHQFRQRLGAWPDGGHQAVAADKSLAAPYLDASWFWREGNASLTGKGDTWDSLLNSRRAMSTRRQPPRGDPRTRSPSPPGWITAPANSPGHAGGHARRGPNYRLCFTVRRRSQAAHRQHPGTAAGSRFPAAPADRRRHRMELPTYLEVLPG